MQFNWHLVCLNGWDLVGPVETCAWIFQRKCVADAVKVMRKSVCQKLKRKVVWEPRVLRYSGFRAVAFAPNLWIAMNSSWRSFSPHLCIIFGLFQVLSFNRISYIYVTYMFWYNVCWQQCSRNRKKETTQCTSHQMLDCIHVPRHPRFQQIRSRMSCCVAEEVHQRDQRLDELGVALCELWCGWKDPLLTIEAELTGEFTIVTSVILRCPTLPFSPPLSTIAWVDLTSNGQFLSL